MGGEWVGKKEGKRWEIRKVEKIGAEEEEGVLKPDTQELGPPRPPGLKPLQLGGLPSSTPHTFGP